MSQGQDGRWVLAIDFGTSNTTAAVCAVGGRPKELRFRLEPRLPSAVLLASDGRFAVGSAAIAQKAAASDRYVDTPKRQVGKGSTVLGGTPVTDESLVSAVYESVYSEAVRQAGGAAPDLVALTHPAAWQAGRLGVLTRAFDRALRSVSAEGALPEVRLIPEPVAAASYLDGEARLADGALVGVLDCGGGTVDAAVVERVQGDYRILGRAEGIDPLGGVDFDHALLGHVMAQLPELAQRLSLPSQADADTLLVLLDNIRVAKESLSENATVVVRVPPFPPELTDAADIQVTRDEFRRLVAADLDRAAGLLSETAGRSAPGRALDAVFLIGGTSRIPALAGAVAERLGTSPQEFGDPQLAVSLGAAELLRRSWVPAGRPTALPDAMGAAGAVTSTAATAPEVEVEAPAGLDLAAVGAPSEGLAPSQENVLDPVDQSAANPGGPLSPIVDATVGSTPAGGSERNPPDVLSSPRQPTPAPQWSAFTKGAIAGAIVAVVGLIVFAFTAGDSGDPDDSADSGDSSATSNSLIAAIGGAATDESCDALTSDELKIFPAQPSAGALCVAPDPPGTTGFTLLAVDEAEISRVANQVSDAVALGQAIEQPSAAAATSRMGLVCTEGNACGWVGYLVDTTTEFRITTTLTDPTAAVNAMAGYSILPGSFLTKPTA